MLAAKDYSGGDHDKGKQGTILSDPFLRTNIPNIYVCGDVAGPYQFTHVAAHQAWYASVKVLTAPGKDRVLGVTIVGHSADEMIAEYVAAMKHGFGMNKILSTIHIYPTFSETNKYAAGVWKREHVPAGVLSMLGCFHAWRRGQAIKKPSGPPSSKQVVSEVDAKRHGRWT